MPVVCFVIDSLLEEENIIEFVEFGLNHTDRSGSVLGLSLRRGLVLLPHTEHRFCYEPHIPRRWLQLFERLREQAFKFCLAMFVKRQGPLRQW